MTGLELDSLNRIMSFTYDYVGTWPCGCVLAVVSDMPMYAKDTAKSVSKLIRDGVKVDRVPHETFQTMEFGHKITCEIKDHRERAERRLASKAMREAAK